MQRGLIIIALAGAMLGCHDSDPVAPPDSSPVGTYSLVAFDGRQLPVSEEPAVGHIRQVLAGSLVLNADGTCLMTERVIDTQDGVSLHVSSIIPGSYQVGDRGRLALTCVNGSHQSVSYAGDVVAYSDFFNTRTYHRLRP